MKNYIYKSILLPIAILFATNTIAQTPFAVDQVKGANLKNIDWLSLNYRYIDKDYNVVIDSATYQKALVTFQLPAAQMKTYTDSVAVAMMLEFNDWNTANKAISKVGYTWIKQSYYMWMTPAETKKLAASLGLNHPYKLRQWLSSENNTRKKALKVLKKLKTKLDKAGLKEYDKTSRAKLLSYAYTNNPDKIAFYAQKRAEKKRLMEAYKKRHGKIDRMKIGVGCDEPNCCQKENK